MDISWSLYTPCKISIYNIFFQFILKILVSKFYQLFFCIDKFLETKITQNNPVRYSMLGLHLLHFDQAHWGVLELRVPFTSSSHSSAASHLQWFLVPIFLGFMIVLWFQSFFFSTFLHKMTLYIYSLYTPKPVLPRNVKIFLMINRSEYFTKDQMDQ